ncbi:MAG: IgGFc-binding protein [Enhygromyxa sp.]
MKASPILFAPLFLLLLSAGVLACQVPPSAEGDDEVGDGDGDPSDEGDGDLSGEGDGDPSGESDGDDSPPIICVAGETRCAGPSTLEICAPTGLVWMPIDCQGYEQCEPSLSDEEGNTFAKCVGPCDRLADTPSSEGCSFYTTSMYQTTLPPDVPKPPDAFVIGNPQLELDATVELRWVPFGSNKEQLVTEIDGMPIENPVVIPPGGTHVFELDPALTIYQGKQETSLYRSGSVYHVVSDLPVVAYLHAPYEGQNSNGATLLLPENVLKEEYVVYNHGAWQSPNYFIVIAMHNQTTVTWSPSVETAGNWLPLPFVEQGESGSQLLNRFDNIRIDTSIKYERPKCEQDLSGTVISADKPIWVVSAVRGLRLPWCGGSAVPGCPSEPENIDTACNYGSDFAMEQNLPLHYWGREYVGPHSPLRGNESHHWRIFAGQPDVTVNVTPPQPGTPIHLAERGDWADLIVPAGTHLEFDANGVFMPVQYVTGHYDDANDKGSPAMIQMVPTAQFLDRYVFVTAFNYPEHYVQVIREAGTAQVLLDGEAVEGWESVGGWEIATVQIDEGSHEIISEDPFGIMQYGYSPHVGPADNSAGYGYMGGMKAEVIFIP